MTQNWQFPQTGKFQATSTTASAVQHCGAVSLENCIHAASSVAPDCCPIIVVSVILAPTLRFLALIAISRPYTCKTIRLAKNMHKK